MIALVIGAVVAIAAVGYVLYPIFFRSTEPRPAASRRAAASPAGAEPNATIDDEIEAAVRAYRRGDKKHDRCAACGTPIVARDAQYCSSCGNRLPA
jgi:hypothetical protein